MKLSRDELKSLMKNKMVAAGLREDHAEQTAEVQSETTDEVAE